MAYCFILKTLIFQTTLVTKVKPPDPNLIYLIELSFNNLPLFYFTTFKHFLKVLNVNPNKVNKVRVLGFILVTKVLKIKVRFFKNIPKGLVSNTFSIRIFCNPKYSLSYTHCAQKIGWELAMTP